MDHLTPVSYKDVDITGGFWAYRQKLNREVTIYSVRDRFEDTGRFKAFEFTWTKGSDEPKPHYFWDSDIAKWLESAAYIIAKNPDDKLLRKVDEVIDLIEKNQQPDGYFNIYHTIVEPELRFKDRSHHELYCLGHLIEAAVAYLEATGSDRFIKILDKYIDLVIRVFTVEKSAAFVTPGHEEIELALIRLYRARPDKKYLDLAAFFINERGQRDEDCYDWGNGSYNQSHLPVREQREVMGHCVRACYLYSGMADAAKETGDAELLTACRALFDDIVSKKAYITGGIGSSHRGEAFTTAYDLPNDTAYAETCAAISLSFFADRMKDIDLDSKYADTVERVMYNGMLSGVSLDGRAFFYENPLEINLADRTRHTSVRDGDRLPITQRLEVFGCSCCPPNVTRYIAALGSSVLSYDADRIVLHQFMPIEASVGGASISVRTAYPLDGKIQITLRGAKGKKLLARVPGWCEKSSFSRERSTLRGYAVFEVDSDEFTLDAEFVMKPALYRAHPSVRADAGAAAVGYGPVIYCAEGVDNGSELYDIRLEADANAEVKYDPYFGVNVLSLGATRTDKKSVGGLYYFASAARRVKTEVRLIPYFAFANRGESDMRVFLEL